MPVRVGATVAVSGPALQPAVSADERPGSLLALDEPFGPEHRDALAIIALSGRSQVERMTGIEPALSAWELACHERFSLEFAG